MDRCGDLLVAQGAIDYGDGTPVSIVSVMNLQNGPITPETQYFASPFEAPDWRSQWVERI